MALASMLLVLTLTPNAITEGMYVLYPFHLLTFFFPALRSWSPISPPSHVTAQLTQAEDPNLPNLCLGQKSHQLLDNVTTIKCTSVR